MSRKLSSFAVSNTHFPFFPKHYYCTIKGFKCGTKNINNLDDALQLFDEMILVKPTLSSRNFNNLLSIMLKMNHHSHVIQLYKELDLLGRAVDEYTRSIVINSYCKLKEVGTGFAVLGGFVKRGYAPDVVSINCLMKGLFIEGKVGEGIGLFRKLVMDKYCEVDKFTFSTVLSGLCKCGETMKAVELLEVLEEEGYELDVFVYNTVIEGLCENKMVEEAMGVLSKMIGRGVVPNVITGNALIRGLCVVRRCGEAKKLLNQMVTEWSVSPDVRTFTILMDGYSLNGQPDDVRAILDSMVGLGVKPDVVSYVPVISGYCKQKKIDQAWTLFSEMREKGPTPDARLYNIMLQGLFSVSRCNDALKLVDEMKSNFNYMDIYTCGIILNGLLSNRLIEDATTFFHEKEREGSACHIGWYTIYIHGLCNHGQIDLACSIFNNLSSKGLHPNVRTYTAMIQGLCQAGLHQKAKELLEEMEQSGCFLNKITYNVIIQGCVYRDSQDSIDLLKLISERDFPIDSHTFSMLLQQMSRSNEDSAMRSLIHKLISKDEAHVISSNATGTRRTITTKASV